MPPRGTAVKKPSWTKTSRIARNTPATARAVRPLSCARIRHASDSLADHPASPGIRGPCLDDDDPPSRHALILDTHVTAPEPLSHTNKRSLWCNQPVSNNRGDGEIYAPQDVALIRVSSTKRSV